MCFDRREVVRACFPVNRRYFPVCTPRGFTLVEVMIALAIFAMAASTIASIFGTSIRQDSFVSRETQALNLSSLLMSEISQRRFRESVAAPGNGPSPLESASFDRRNFDDIGDYAIFRLTWGTLSPPRNEAGGELTNYASFGQYADVYNISVSADGTVDSTPQADGTTDFKLITVSTSWGNGKNSVSLYKISALP